ncbi:ABC transporter ATP-binding protein [Streptomyces winkii]|uniref:ABC transporter ATP-binding protein n=1 Tax=Streptomyces winkii TaxID=3051178 RepID=UPI0028D45D41|nr:ABC transporter ATP-binding protein [Streptomyces sp. DSM 40971]
MDVSGGLTVERSSASQRAEPVLTVRDLTVEIRTQQGLSTPVANLSYELAAGEILGVVGESGSGKSIGSLALCGLGPSQAQTTGSVQFRGEELLGRRSASLQHIRGRDIGYVFQDPQAALNPLMTCGDQVAEILRAHKGTPRGRGRRRAAELFEAVGLPDPERRVRQYPHELSGGMRQRVMIAMAVCCEPSVIVADEPTTALDVVIQAQVIDLLRDVRDRTGAAMIFISHDLNLVSSLADRILVMHGGRVIEKGPTAQIVETPSHPYTKALLASTPELLGPRVERFAGVDERIFDAMRAENSGGPEYAEAVAELLVADEAAPEGAVPLVPAAGPERSDDAVPRAPVPPALASVPDGPEGPERPDVGTEALLDVRDLSVRYGSTGRFGRRTAAVEAVAGVSLSVGRGRILGVVGESGSGKTTLARALVGLERPSEGTITFDGTRVFPSPGRGRYQPPRAIQMVFQDPYASLNPRMRVVDLVAEGLDINRAVRTKAERTERVAELLTRVGIDPELRHRYPHQFSGGQRQRIAIARALAVDPALLVCDEAVSSLDVSIRAHVLNVLEAERRRSGLPIIFIGHDLGVVRHLADHTVVMHRGRIVEQGPTEDVIFRPQNSYTRRLVAASQYGFEQRKAG